MSQKFNFPGGEGKTSGGKPLPLTGTPITETPIIARQEGATLKKYSEHFIPGQEELAKDEMRITCLGSGAPNIRKGQSSAGWFVELGNGDKFVFDIGGGTVGNLWALEVPPNEVDKVFLTHLHIDHTGDLHPLLDAFGWGRFSPLKVWGPSGYTKEMGTAHFVDLMDQAALWAYESKAGHVPSDGMKMEAHEIDMKSMTPEKLLALVYDENGVKISTFPTNHLIYGAVAYRVDWEGLSFVFSGDSMPSEIMAEQAKEVDVLVHEVGPTPEVFSEKMHLPIEQAKSVIYGAHTPPDMLGVVLDKAKPKLGVGYHYYVNDDTIDPFYKSLRTTYKGDVALAQDLMVINLSQEQIVTRMAKVDYLAWPAPSTGKYGKVAKTSEAKIPEWIRSKLIKPSVNKVNL